jgi:hypothetical protein
MSVLALSSAFPARFIKNPAFSVEMSVGIRRVGQTFRTYRLTATPEKPDYARVLLAAAQWDGKGALPRSLRDHEAFLVELGILVRSDEAPVPVEPDVPLDRSLLEWISERARHDASEMECGSLALNPELKFQSEKARPKAKEGALPPAPEFPRGPGLLWVQSPEHRTWAAYRPSDDVLDLVRRLRRGRLRVSALDDETRELLVHARVLVARNAAKDGWKVEAARQTRKLRREGYALIPNLLTPLQVAQMRRYIRAREREGYLEHDANHARRLRSYNDVLATHLHRQTAHVIRQVTGASVVPSFSYVSRYLAGTKLDRHVDRDQCHFTLSCLIDSKHGLDLGRSSPLHLESRGKTREVRLELGEAIVYEGRKVPHWREVMRPGEEQTTLLLFYVPVGFTGSAR